VSRLEATSFSRALSRLRRRLLARNGLRGLAIGTLVYAGARLGGLTASLSLAAGLTGLSLGLAILTLHGRSRWPNPERFAEHLNRRFPSFEESAQLLLPDSKQAGALRDLQRRRIEAAWDGCLGQTRTWLPRLRATPALAVITLGLVLSAGAKPIRAWLDEHIAQAGGPGDLHLPGSRALLVSVEARIMPPAYTGLPETIADQPELSVVAGSGVEWRFTFDRPGNYQLELSDRVARPLENVGDNQYAANARIEDTQLYRIHRDHSGGARELIGVYGIEAVPDRPPVVRFLPPNETLLEIARDDAPRFSTRTRVTDDFGVTEAEIRASVARGAGEGVKFRDELLAFDSSILDDNGIIYQRFWDLEQLGMKPGDEIYFFINAFDNREPDANRGRSDTVVVRWLDESTADMAEAGIAIDVLPEYFKSQRQIIIETEQLITDRPYTDADTFDDLSRTLGQDQSSLKQRYGQYLGDETEGFAPAPEEESAENHEPGQAHDEEHEEDLTHAHEGSSTDGAAALIERFTHEHEAAEIGPITQRNPVGLMKRALGQMWQAELHLLLSDPERALPYEYEALKYLGLARQAERIYTQRLGFEPPPVTEDRRLTGDLDDIEPYARTEPEANAITDGRAFAEAFQVLSRPEPLSEAGMARLRLAGDRLSQWAASRPALLGQAAALERWMADPAGTEHACPSCRRELAASLWLLIEEPEPPPDTGRRTLAVDDPMTVEYTRLRAAPASGAIPEDEG
jgi:hypothetical protein